MLKLTQNPLILVLLHKRGGESSVLCWFPVSLLERGEAVWCPGQQCAIPSSLLSVRVWVPGAAMPSWDHRSTSQHTKDYRVLDISLGHTRPGLLASGLKLCEKKVPNCLGYSCLSCLLLFAAGKIPS